MKFSSSLHFNLHRNSMFVSNSEIGLNAFSATMMPSHFGGGLRLPIGFANDPHNHFAAFRKCFVDTF